MYQKRFVLCSAAAVLALAIACSKASETPTSPSGSGGGATEALPDGVTLKATAPTVISPMNGAQPESLTLVASKAEGKFNKNLKLIAQLQILVELSFCL